MDRMGNFHHLIDRKDEVRHEVKQGAVNVTKYKDHLCSEVNPGS